MRRFLKILSWRLRGGRICKVRGHSMRPDFESGDVVLLDSSSRRDPPIGAGDVVVTRHPFRRNTRILKRVEHLTEEGRLFLKGDDLEGSTDSRSFGSIDPSAVLGVVVANLGS
jgi:nickel-type superoxide dismutase maturation protease